MELMSWFISIYSWLFSWRSYRRLGFCGYHSSWETQCWHILSCYRVLTRGEYLDEVPWWETRTTELLSVCDIHLPRLWCSWVSCFLVTNKVGWKFSAKAKIQCKGLLTLEQIFSLSLVTCQQTFTCLKSTIETLENGNIDVVLVLLLLTSSVFHIFF